MKTARNFAQKTWNMLADYKMLFYSYQTGSDSKNKNSENFKWLYIEYKLA